MIERKVTPQAKRFEKITLVIFENLFARGVITFFEMTYEISNLEHEIMAPRRFLREIVRTYNEGLYLCIHS